MEGGELERRQARNRKCVTARADCTGYSSKEQDASIPRSIVQHLEAEIAKIEGDLARNGHLEELNASDILAGMPTHNGVPFTDHVNPALELNKQEDDKLELAAMPRAPNLSTPDEQDPDRQEIMKCKELQALIYAILAPGPGMTDLIARVRMNLTPSTALATLPSPRGTRRKSLSRPTTHEISCVMLKSIPINIIKSLMKKYMTRVYPIFPVLHAPSLWQQLDNVLRTLQGLPPGHRTLPPSFDFLIIYLCLSVSATLGSAKTGHEQKHMVFSGSLFEEGIQHYSEKAKIPSDLAGLQITCLVLQYASINPRQANVWMLTGTVMRACLELGLHREPPDQTAYDHLTLDLRRRVFWSAYCFDRSICSALQRPLSIPDETIDAQFPSALDDRHIHPHGIDPTGIETKGLTLWLQFRRLQSHMTEVHFQNKPLNAGQTWDDWLDEMERRLRAWYDDYNEGNELIEFTLMHGLTNLHRPSPRAPMPPPRSLMLAFEAACSSAKSLREHIVSGFYRRSWLIAHHVLENSMVVLFCLRWGFEDISAKFGPQQIFEMTKVFTANFLTLASQGWDEVSNYAGIYERLLGPLLESVFSNKPPSLSSFGPAQDAELTRLLYPGPAQLEKLRFGTHSYDMQGHGAMNGLGDMGLPPFDVASLNWEDFSVSDGGSGGPGAGASFLDSWDVTQAGLDLSGGQELFGMS
ncbi:hypothetical protein LTR70_004145 [Exophiala xenobiotica]|uniref:Xylanolytic transcriptional activator regulatory domain-containing protein n=1 Tax=Lithohypha guttulata TaxID=1690604 RepID=A0ABR0KEN7_9EURO|nr:hypothetical protein LTR24_003573 [Lithohypha guttulata]KAK5321589.1 hypothetical protein LTR70_004145 [Exophiala xenobiotica]